MQTLELSSLPLRCNFLESAINADGLLDLTGSVDALDSNKRLLLLLTCKPLASLLGPLEFATIQILSRWCGAPTFDADTTPHLASNPNEAKSPRTVPSPLEVSIGEFST